ncbi:hypothetical protein COT75_01780 [Candidatus Beckwithbacteria bacterium CG10_big_fil_rev_8_21_14_0_10_34_10]|uniref:Glycosyltransferase RgtA/B/C/D-like domain-containing protein n=1 Tax=Candidatus Beckwithbacteria bacterium CG10_big_fil_rev_8_21_14_0_10_34_10 TaxID=1974495 RepID=A0A2H0WBT1_9BACT|nr:MAG: hypothetical protein COT75_01780 [Candidatus Beckwithbacteria bacterium CG10_big_fil_rev_8_21_14_0_10_34_10]
MKKEKIFLLVILILAFFLRFYRLNKVPPSLSWDETAIGYNAYSIWKTGKDEFGFRLPFAFKSFGDYKSPLLVYLTVPFVGIFGLNEWAVRFPSALISFFTAIVVYLLVKELFKNNKISLITGFLMAISPWHLQFSRPAFEPNLAFFWVTTGVLMFLKGLKKPMFFILSSLSFMLAMYSYHSPKLFLPFFLVGLGIIYWHKIFKKENIRYLSLSFFLALLLSLPLLKIHLGGEAGARFTSTGIFYTKEGGKKPFDFKLIGEIGKSYLVHFSPQFLFFGNNDNFRNKMKSNGLFYFIEAPFLLIGFWFLLKQKKEKWAKLLLTWIFLAPIPAIITIEAPHSLRASNLLIPLMIVISLGIKRLFNFFESKRYKKVFYVLFFLFYITNIGYYLYSYYVRLPVYAAPDWQYGYKEMVQYVETKENEVEKIIITLEYGQPHIFIQFYQKLKPLEIWQEKLGKYQFREINWQKDKNLSKVLLVATPKEVPLESIPPRAKIEKEIYFPDGSVSFRIIKL